MMARQLTEKSPMTGLVCTRAIFMAASAEKKIQPAKSP
jgi:hypothetical protein